MAAIGGLYGARAWRAVRLVVLARDGHLCRIQGPRCTLNATEVDHIVRPEDGGAWYDPANLRASCGPCNRGRRVVGFGQRLVGGVVLGRPTRPVPPSREW
jgi:5-methylcytosine-specific restriction endonuclease McrA